MRTVNVIEGLFFAALEKRTPLERNAYLDQACTGDPELRRCVERMLDAQPKIGDFLQLPAASATTESPPISERPGSVIGAYKLLQELGEGGFGVVFLAEQTEPVRRKVALKIIKPGMDCKQVIARFEAERQALALMDHPNISKVHDAGTTDSGRPYFVMELVKGVPITEFCDKNRLTPKERLELFIPVCQAVQHAHQKGIIHRDIKPSNVLVTLYDDEAVPKVIDFGVAKAVEQKLTEQTLFTRVGQVVGTLEYMSPEQASLNALDVDTRSDVYALGVLLYELLTGSTPLNKERLQGVAFLEMLRLIREEEPPRPSTRLSQSGLGLPMLAAFRKSDSQKLPKLVRGELDWIAMKALDKDRAHRYATANALARDVQHYLADEAVEACPPSASYRVRKFARKNRTALTAAAVFAALLLVGIAVSSWQAVRATRAEDHAITERDDAEKARAAEAEQRGVAVAERDAANAARAELRRAHYAATMNLIPTAWEADNYGRALELLDDLRPKAPDELDLRGFEWHYWDRLCHAERRTLKLEEPGRVLSPVLSGDGSRMAGHVVVNDGEAKTASFVKVWDTASGRELRSWPVETIDSDQHVPLVLNQDGSRLVAHYIGNVRARAEKPWLQVWDVSAGKVIFTRSGRYGNAAITPDGKRLATFDGDGNTLPRVDHVVRVWDLTAPDREPAVMEGPDRSFPHDLKFSADGTRLACSYPAISSTSSIRIWDTATGKACARIEAEQPVDEFGGVAFSPDGTRLAAVGERRGGVQPGMDRRCSSYLWERTAGDGFKLLRSTPTAGLGRPNVAFSPDGRNLAVWSGLVGSPAVRLLYAASGAERQVVRGHVASVASVAFSGDGTRLFTAGDTAVKEWGVAPATAPSLAGQLTVQSPAGDRLAVYRRAPAEKPEGGSKITIQDRAGKEIAVFRGHTTGVTSVMFSPDGRLVLSKVWSSDVKIWEADTGKLCWESSPKLGYRGWDQPFSPDGRFVALLDSDGVKVVRTANFQPLFTIGKAISGHFSPNGSRLVASYGNTAPPDEAQGPRGGFKLWDVEAGREIVSLPPHSLQGSVVFSRDSRYFASTSQQPHKDLTVWDATTGAPRVTLKDASAVDVAFSPDGTRVVTAEGSFPRQIRWATVWDLESGEVLYRLKGHSGWVGKVAFSPDGKRIASAAFEGGRSSGDVKLWDAATGRELLSLKSNPLSGRTMWAELSFSPDGHRIILVPGLRDAAFSGGRSESWDATPRAKE
jgi:serine/threonine protein kinase/WD40 repeat protein